MASFSDTDTTSPASSYSATVDWGDGSAATLATITAIPDQPGSFTISAGHTYTEPGSYTVTVTVTGGDSATTTASSRSTATVADTTLEVFGRGTLTLASESFNGELARFHYGTASVLPSGFRASINWGDGHTGTGTITGSDGNYLVSGAHTFAGQGPYAVRVTVTDPADETGAATTTILVPSTISALSLPPRISAKALLCRKRHHKCPGVEIIGSFRSPGSAVWTLTLSKAGRGAIKIGSVTRTVKAGQTALIFKVTNRRQARKLYRMVRRHKLNRLTVAQAFTNQAGGSSHTSLFAHVSR